jgi:hypothetical protein
MSNNAPDIMLAERLLELVSVGYRFCLVRNAPRCRRPDRVSIPMDWPFLRLNRGRAALRPGGRSAQVSGAVRRFRWLCLV